MTKVHKYSKEQFIKVVEYLNITAHFDFDFVYDVYSFATDAIEEVYNSNLLPSYNIVNPNELVLFTCGEYLYSISGRTQEDIDKFHQNSEFKTSMASVVADKFLSLSHFAFKERKIANQYLPPMSSLNLYLNFILNILKTYKKNDPKSTLITDLLVKSISLCKCVLNLLMDGNETEAFSTWRTLHECECTLILLEKHGDVAIEAYLKHMKYGIAYKDLFANKEEQDNIFLEIKEGMKEHNLKSKDMKKFIEYGWLYSIEETNNLETFKLNFRDGLEALAGLQAYAKRYENSSEIIHSTPMLFYANKENYYFMSLLCVYESFFRLERIFVNLFAKNVTKEGIEKYNELRKVYYVQLINIHKKESAKFIAWKQRVNKK